MLSFRINKQRVQSFFVFSPAEVNIVVIDKIDELLPFVWIYVITIGLR